MVYRWLAIFFGKPQTRRAGYRGSRSPTLLDFRPNAPTDIYDTYRFRVERLSQMCQFRLFVYLVSGLFVPLRYIGNGRIVYLPSRRAISANFRPLLLGGYSSDLKIPMGQFEKGFVSSSDTTFPAKGINFTPKTKDTPRGEKFLLLIVYIACHDRNSIFPFKRCTFIPLILPFYTLSKMPAREQRHSRWANIGNANESPIRTKSLWNRLKSLHILK